MQKMRDKNNVWKDERSDDDGLGTSLRQRGHEFEGCWYRGRWHEQPLLSKGKE